MDQPPPTSTAAPGKLRLMCSYGGHIIPRHNAKSLYYAGGDTRIITIATAATDDLTLSALISHLAARLHLNNPFAVKYQLPRHDLDSLISLATDEDLQIMLEEHHRLLPTRSRLRLFLFPIKPSSDSPAPEPARSELKHPKTESWFCDALKGAKIMQCQGNNGICGGGSGGEVEGGCGVCGAESILLETSSSFGSTSSSVSSSNLPAKSQVEDSGAGSHDGKAKYSASDLSPSDNGIGVAVCHPQPASCRDQGLVDLVSIMDHKVSSDCFESEKKCPDPPPPTGVELNKIVQVSELPLSSQFDQPARPWMIHTVAPQYIPPSSAGILPIPPYYVMNSPVVPQQHFYYQANQPYPVYFIPVGQPHNLPMQSGLVNSAPVVSDRPLVHPNSLFNPAQVVYRVASTSPVPELASQVYRTVPMATSVVNMHHIENREPAGGQVGGVPRMNPMVQSMHVTSVETPKFIYDYRTVPMATSTVDVHHRESREQSGGQAGGVPPMNHVVQSMRVASVETPNVIDVLSDDPARVQIYKSQPPPPTLPSQYQTMTPASAVLLSEALEQLHMDNIKQQSRASQLQPH